MQSKFTLEIRELFGGTLSSFEVGRAAPALRATGNEHKRDPDYYYPYSYSQDQNRDRLPLRYTFQKRRTSTSSSTLAAKS